MLITCWEYGIDTNSDCAWKHFYGPSAQEAFYGREIIGKVKWLNKINILWDIRIAGIVGVILSCLLNM